MLFWVTWQSWQHLITLGIICIRLFSVLPFLLLQRNFFALVLCQWTWFMDRQFSFFIVYGCVKMNCLKIFFFTFLRIKKLMICKSFHMFFFSVTVNTENSPKIESMPTLCRSATLPTEITISKRKCHGNYKAASSVAHRRDISFPGLRAIASLRPPSNFRDAPVFWSYQVPLYGTYSAPIAKGMPHRSCSQPTY